MRLDAHLRSEISRRLDELAARMSEWQAAPRVDQSTMTSVLDAIQPFAHTTSAVDLSVAGVDGTGDFPALAFSDSYVYVTVAQATRYAADVVSQLKEISPVLEPLMEFTWIPEDENRRRTSIEEAFALLAGSEVDEVIDQSDYRTLKARELGRTSSVGALRESLILPHAADLGNIAIQRYCHVNEPPPRSACAGVCSPALPAHRHTIR